MFKRTMMAAAAALAMATSAQAATYVVEFDPGTGAMIGTNGWADGDIRVFVMGLNIEDGELVLPPGGQLAIQTNFGAHFVSGFDIDTDAPVRITSFRGVGGVIVTPDGLPGFQHVSFGPSGQGFNVTRIFADASSGFRIDNIQVAHIPEPATWGLMILGFAGLGGALRSRKAQAQLQG